MKFSEGECEIGCFDFDVFYFFFVYFLFFIGEGVGDWLFNRGGYCY